MITQQLAALQTEQKWRCVSLRNQYIEGRIKLNFAGRQKKVAQGKQHGNEYDGSVDVIPVSATAFRDHLVGREPMGFPTKLHTGIPRLRQWLADSTLERREEHLDGMLNSLQRLFRSIEHWALINGGGQSIRFSRGAVEDLFRRTHAQFVTVRHRAPISAREGQDC